MSRKPLLVLVTGVPGSGKTTLAAALNARLGFALLSRDDFQVRLWNLWQDQPDLLPHVPRAHWAAYYATVDALLDTGVSVVAEGSVHTTRGAAEIAVLLPKADAVVIHCVASRAVTHERFRTRTGVGRRQHPAYTDAENLRQMEENPARWAHFEQPVALEIPKLIVDTGGSYQPRLDNILEFIWKRE
ncbi:AAA family ATPase [Deinococcus radiopugnans]|uniref:ATP-binding protein n=1 Tax=Deinococcus radiopugnans ATCC 19172 TaxID=585398 RepID=A0A5C4Y4V8_9DEIO|nr:AAA family ATPase [Deinococcus radiopugnans]MBB6018253.1 putative kinase [Deinococcus radiopugnans ATCC 19172]TNM70422.1 ATP-binding protein [Deinococcus radiopugnans ATCC 19172]